MLESLKDITYILELYLIHFLNDCNEPKELFKLLKVDKILSFNYTNTYSKIYGKGPGIHYIHGNAVKDRNIEDNNMVFGISDSIEYLEESETYDYVDFQKYYQRIVKKTGNKYKKWLSGTHFLTKVFFYGHSMDVTDKDIIKELVETQGTKIYIFYYELDKTALNKITLNLVQIFKKDKLIEYTGNGKINFIGTNDLDKVKQILTN